MMVVFLWEFVELLGHGTTAGTRGPLGASLETSMSFTSGPFSLLLKVTKT